MVGGAKPRVSSPAPGRSILITSAPRSASICAQVGPARTRVRSNTRRPRSGPVGWFIDLSCAPRHQQVAFPTAVLYLALSAAPRTGSIRSEGDFGSILIKPAVVPATFARTQRKTAHVVDIGALVNSDRLTTTGNVICKILS